MRLLMVEDDPRIAQPTVRSLEEAGHSVSLCSGGKGGLLEARAGGFDALILDVMLPDLDGFALARTLREEGLGTPIVFLTARAGLPDRVEGLDLGGDAYLTKPFELGELLATLRAVVRRSGTSLSARTLFGEVGLLDSGSREVWWNALEVGLTAREYALLETLTLARGRWFTREELLGRVWGPDFAGEARIVDVYVSYLRRKLSGEVIESARGRGYRLP